MDNASEIVTLPTFDGKERHQQGRHDVTAEAFLARLESHTMGLAPHQRVARTSGQFRGTAADWWQGIKDDISGMFEVNSHQAQTNWEFFCRIFKDRFFTVVDTSHTVEDITDVKQEAGESVHHYAERLMRRAGAINNVILQGVKQRIAQAEAVEAMNADARAIFNGLNNANQGVLFTGIRDIVELYLNQISNRQAFMSLCRTLGRNANDAWARTQAKKTIQSPTSTFVELHRELSMQQRAHIKGNGKTSVSAAKDFDSGEQDGSSQEEQGVSALRGGFRGRGRGRGGRGRGKPRGGATSGHNQSNNEANNGGAQAKWCIFCSKDTHNTDQCRTLEHYKRIHNDRPGANNNNNHGRKTGNGSKASSVREGEDKQEEEEEDDHGGVGTPWQPVGSVYAGRASHRGRYPPAGNA